MKLTELQALISEFIESKNLKPNSIRAYQTDLFLFSQFYIAEKVDLLHLKQDQLRYWLKQYPVRAAQRRGTNVRCFLLWLNQFKNYSIEASLLLPWQFTQNKPKKPDQAANLTDEQVIKLVEAKFIPLKHRILIALLIFTGASLEELAILAWQDLNLGKLAHITLGEAGKTRVIPLENNLANLIRELRQRTKDPYVFTTERDGSPISSAYMAIIVRRWTFKVLNLTISPTQIQEYAKAQLLKKFPAENIDLVLQRLGKKNAFSLVKSNTQTLDLARLKKIHTQAFAGSKLQ